MILETHGLGMDEALRMEIEDAKKYMAALNALLPPGGISAAAKEGVIALMDDMISQEYEPYFSLNAALHVLACCQRCGRCCREEKTVAVSADDARRIARYLGISLKKFMKEYTRPHELGESVGSARMMKKVAGEPCPFFDPVLPGCRIHSVKPQVCSAAYYLSKMNLLLCEERKELSVFPDCPADRELRGRIANFAQRLERDSEARRGIEKLFSPSRPEAELFRLLLRLKGMEIYFGREKAERLARMMGIERMLEERDMDFTACCFLFFAICIKTSTMN